MNIMPDIQPEHRGLNYWATPIWLSMEKKHLWNKDAEDAYAGVRKSVTVKPSRGKTMHFDSGADCAAHFKIKRNNLSVKIERARNREDKRIKFDGKYYTLIEDALDTIRDK